MDINENVNGIENTAEDAPMYDKEHNTLSTDKIGVEQIKQAFKTLQKYKQGKKSLEEKIVRNEQWWKIRHWDTLSKEYGTADPKPASGWLFNCLMSKHADFMDAVPAPAILPREEGDRQEAKILQQILPVIMERNDFEQVYSDETMYKLKNGTGVYQVVWDNTKLNGLGDIDIMSKDILEVFWEPGVKDIQKSRNFFAVELLDNEVIEETYPVTKGLLKKSNDSVIKKYIYDENIDTSSKSLVIDWYYKKVVGGKTVLHYCKFVDEIVIYATENDTTQPTEQQMMPVTDEMGQQVIDEEGLPMLQPVEVATGSPMSERGWYDHGLYPFVFDVLFKEEGMPVGFGFVDVCKHPQLSIDVLNNAFEKNALFGASPRYMFRQDGSINEEEFSDPTKTLIHVSGNLGDDSIKPVVHNALDSMYVTVLNNKIEELKETSGNRDTSNGGTSNGVTAASAIAAMQEQSGKGSRLIIKSTYRAYSQVINLCIELIRQFYDENRQFRIIGDKGREEYITYNNAGIKEQSQGNAYGVDLGYRLPVFDIKVSAQKASTYSQLSQNELALQIYNAGFFNPQMADQALGCLDMMEFEGKDEVVQKIEANSALFMENQALKQQLLMLSQMVDKTTGSNLSESLAADMTGQVAGMPEQANTEGISQAATGELKGKENAIVSRARETSQAASRPR